jgi:hypothetical protein
MPSFALRHAFLVPLALLLGACVGPGIQERLNAFVVSGPSETKIAWTPAEKETNGKTNLARDTRAELEAYFMCNRAAAAIVSSQRGDPASLAVAARAFCKTEDHNLKSALVAAGQKLYGPSTNHLAVAMRTLRAARKQAIENNLADIVAFRATANPSPAPQQPSGTARPKAGRDI